MKVRFSLRWLLVVLTMAALSLAALAISARRQAAIVAQLQALGCTLETEPVWPESLWAPLGESYSQRIVGVEVSVGASRRAIPHLAKLRSLRTLDITGVSFKADQLDAAVAQAGRALPAVDVTGFSVMAHPIYETE
ncbi:MAG: hypothetical protein CMJ58_27805 [Planctomycetaceae bacterium]|nr:hypothetical protein [Planctomycetaceae bacterium]